MLEVTTSDALLDEEEEGSQWLLDQTLILDWTDFLLQNASQLNAGEVGIPNLSG